MGRVFADSNVLFPFSVMDLLLALSEDGVLEVIWTDDLLDEWERVIVGRHKRSPESAARITAVVREFFQDSKVDRDEYDDLVAEMPGKDPDDHAHMAAAVVRQPWTILTNNERTSRRDPSRRGVFGSPTPTRISVRSLRSCRMRSSARSPASQQRRRDPRRLRRNCSTLSSTPASRNSPTWSGDCCSGTGVPIGCRN